MPQISYLCNVLIQTDYENSIDRLRQDGAHDRADCPWRGHEIVSIIDVDNIEDFDSPAFASADVAIEFTNPTAASAT